MITSEDVERMQRLSSQGMGNTAIGEVFGLNRQYVGRILRGEAGPHAPSARHHKRLAPAVKKSPEPKSPVEHHNALEMKRRGYPLQYIAAKTRLKYREIEAL